MEFLKVDDIRGEELQRLCDRAVAECISPTSSGRMETLNGIHFEDDEPDPLNSPADTMAVITGLKVNLKSAYCDGGFEVPLEPWTAHAGLRGLESISIKGRTQTEAVVRLLICLTIGRNIPVSGSDQQVK